MFFDLPLQAIRGEVVHNKHQVVALLAITFSVFATSSAWGENRGAEIRVRMLHEEALNAYSNMEMERAIEVLEQALSMAQRESLTGDLPAQLNITYGTVLVLGLNRLADGRERLLAAARESASVEPDPMLSTPLLDQLWTDVVEEVRPPDDGAAQGGPDQGGGGGEGQPPTFGQGRVIPSPVVEQLPEHAVPIYAEVQQVRGVSRVLLAYRGPGMRGFLTVDMEQLDDGYAARIPCHRVRSPQVEYFINVLDESGEVIAQAGTEDDPLEVAIVRELDGRDPSLPGMPPEPPCSEDTWSQEQDERPLRRERQRFVYIDIGIGTGAGIPIATEDELNSCNVGGVELVDRISVNPSLAWTELVLTPSFGFFIRPDISLGIRGRLQFHGALYPGTPHAGGVVLDFRWFPVLHDRVRVFITAGLGAGGIRHPITLQGSTHCGDVYYREARYFMGQLGVGVSIDINQYVGLGAQFIFSILAPELTVQGDITFGLNVSIPRGS